MSVPQLPAAVRVFHFARVVAPPGDYRFRWSIVFPAGTVNGDWQSLKIHPGSLSAFVWMDNTLTLADTGVHFVEAEVAGGPTGRATFTVTSRGAGQASH